MNMKIGCKLVVISLLCLFLLGCGDAKNSYISLNCMFLNNAEIEVMKIEKELEKLEIVKRAVTNSISSNKKLDKDEQQRRIQQFLVNVYTPSKLELLDKRLYLEENILRLEQELSKGGIVCYNSIISYKD